MPVRVVPLVDHICSNKMMHIMCNCLKIWNTYNLIKYLLTNHNWKKSIKSVCHCIHEFVCGPLLPVPSLRSFVEYKQMCHNKWFSQPNSTYCGLCTGILLINTEIILQIQCQCYHTLLLICLFIINMALIIWIESHISLTIPDETAMNM